MPIPLNVSMNLDLNPMEMPNGCKTYGKNWIYNTVNQSIMNESGFTLKLTLRDKERFLGVIPIPKGYVLFTKDETNGIAYGNFTDHIYWYENDILIKDIQSKKLNLCRKYTEIKLDAQKAKSQQKYDQTIGIKAARQIIGEYTYNYMKELIICWSEGIDAESNDTRFLNLSTALGAPAYFENTDGAIESLTLSQNIMLPTVTVDVTDSGDALVGSYQFAIKYKMAANSYTDTFKVTPAVYVTGYSGEGIAPGTSISKSINLTFTNLDGKYKEFKIVIYYKKDASVIIKETSDIIKTKEVFTYSIGNINNYTDGVLEESETHHANYVKCEGMTAFQGELIQGNVVSVGYDVGGRSVDDVGNELAEVMQVTMSQSEPTMLELYFKDVNELLSFQTGENYMIYLNLIDRKGMYINSYPVRWHKGTNVTELCPYTQNPKYHHIPISIGKNQTYYNTLKEGSFHAEYRTAIEGGYRHVDVKSILFDGFTNPVKKTNIQLYSSYFSQVETDLILDFINVDSSTAYSESTAITYYITDLKISSTVENATNKKVCFVILNPTTVTRFALESPTASNPTPSQYTLSESRLILDKNITEGGRSTKIESLKTRILLAIAIYDSTVENNTNSLGISGSYYYTTPVSSQGVNVIRTALNIKLPTEGTLNSILSGFTDIIGAISFSIAERNGTNNRVISQVLFQRDTNANDIATNSWGFLMGGDDNADTAFRAHSLDLLYLKPTLSGVGFQLRYKGLKNVPTFIMFPAYRTDGGGGSDPCNYYNRVQLQNNAESECRNADEAELTAGLHCCVRLGGDYKGNPCKGSMTPPYILLESVGSSGTWSDGTKITSDDTDEWVMAHICGNLQGRDCGNTTYGEEANGFNGNAGGSFEVLRNRVKNNNYLRFIWMRGIKTNITEAALLPSSNPTTREELLIAFEYDNCVYLSDKMGWIVPSTDTKVHTIKTIDYIEANNQISHNTMGESHYRIDFSQALDNEFDWRLNHGIADIVSLSKEFYVDELNQTLVLSSAIYSIDNLPGIIPLKGDTFIGDFTIRATYPTIRWKGENQNNPESDKYIFKIIHSAFLQSRFNLNGRFKGATDGEKIWSGKIYATYLANDVKDLAPFFKVRPNIDNFIKTETGEGYSTALNWNGMNTEQPVKTVTENQVNKLVNRIIRSDKINPESMVLGWQKYKIDNYYDVPLERGAIVSLHSDTSNLYIQQEFGLRVASVKDQLAQGEESAYVGSGNLFDRYPQEVIFDKNGYIGCRDKFMCGITPLGYIVLDSTKGKLFQVLGNDVSEITAQNIKRWAETEFKQELFEPLFGQSYNFGYDAKNTRLLFTRNGSRGENESFTLDWSPAYNWGCFHDYIPNYQFHTRDGWYMISENKLYKGNDPETKCIFFDNDVKQTVLQIVQTSRTTQQGFVRDTEGVNIDKVYNNVIWQTLVKIGNLYFHDETINSLMLHNDTQCTDIIKVNDNLEWFDTETGVGKASKWFFNKIEDAVIDDKKEFLHNFVEVIKSNCALNSKEFWEISNFIGSHLVISLFYDNLFYDSSKKLFVPKPENGKIPSSGQQAEFSLITLDTDVDYSNR